MRKFVKILGVLLIALLLAGLIFGWAVHEPLPQGQPGPAAEALAIRPEYLLKFCKGLKTALR